MIIIENRVVIHCHYVAMILFLCLMTLFVDIKMNEHYFALLRFCREMPNNYILLSARHSKYVNEDYLIRLS